jgi:hypothetical protein
VKLVLEVERRDLGGARGPWFATLHVEGVPARDALPSEGAQVGLIVTWADAGGVYHEIVVDAVAVYPEHESSRFASDGEVATARVCPLLPSQVSAK